MSHYDRETGLIKISWTKIRLQEECRQKAYLVAEGKRRPLTDVRGYFRGNVVDLAMRRWLSLDHPRNHPGWMADQVDAIMDELERAVREREEGVVRWKHDRDRAEVRVFCRETTMRLERMLYEVAIPREYHPAVRFKVPMNVPGLDGAPARVLLIGEMDLLTREPLASPLPLADSELVVPARARSAVRVWDLKVTEDSSYWRKTIAQLVFYDIACFCLGYGFTTEVGLLQPMVTGAPKVSFSVSNDDRAQMFTRIARVAQEIMRGDVAPKAGTAGCAYCEVRDACERYRTEPGTRVVPLF